MANTMYLNEKQQSIVTIAAFTASGDLERLKNSLTEGLDAGLTINEIKEILIQLYAHTGFPRSLNAINTFMAVLEIRRSQGIDDAVGQEPHPLPTNKSKSELGTEIQIALLGSPETSPALTFVPAMDAFVKEHLFADIWGRDNLDFHSRELVTIAALTNLGGVNLQLRRHLKVGLNTGLTPDLLTDLITVIAAKVGKAEAENLREMLAESMK
ncbi:carboxymuconolactone decarboxylase family protein [Tolumonas auensis]|uniref:carboxymuconolactone decarboxylase family protein n=1 Tax=Tolumonas auensis TaxID=43948 RepID=UPI002AA7DEBD|nr:carboxymuconolactone decarboxylase family protein [Tolumonas auensis]